MEIERIVTAEYQCEATKLQTQRFDGFGLPSSCRTVRRAAKSLAKSLCECQETAVGQWRSNQSVRNTQILIAVFEPCIGHLHVQSLQRLCVAFVHVAHGQEPSVVAGRIGFYADQFRNGISLVNRFGDEVLAFLSCQRREIVKYTLGKDVEQSNFVLQDLIETFPGRG